MTLKLNPVTGIVMIKRASKVLKYNFPVRSISWYRTYTFIAQFFFAYCLIFTSQPNIVANAGFHLSLYPNCHHQTVFAKFILNLPPYLREVLHYKDENEIEAKANPDLIKGAIRYVYWEKPFSNTFSVLMRVSLSTR